MISIAWFMFLQAAAAAANEASNIYHNNIFRNGKVTQCQQNYIKSSSVIHDLFFPGPSRGINLSKSDKRTISHEA